MQVINETDIPVPPITASGGRSAKYPFKDMEVGDIKRFVASEQEIRRIQRAVAAYARRNKGTKFVTRRVKAHYDEDDNRVEAGVRVWRVQ